METDECGRDKVIGYSFAPPSQAREQLGSSYVVAGIEAAVGYASQQSPYQLNSTAL